MSLVAYDNSSDEEEEKKIVKKPKESIKIRIPSLKEFEDEEEEEKPSAKKPKLQPGSGLFSLLPPPKHMSTISKSGFVPHILSSKKEQPVITSKQNKKINANIEKTTSLAASEEHESDDESPCVKEKSYEEDSDVAASNDFFWLDDLASVNKAKEEDFSIVAPVKHSPFIQNLSSQLPSISNNNMQQVYINETEENTYIQQSQQLLETDECNPEENSECSFSSEQHLHSPGHYSVTETVSDPKGSLLEDKEFLKLKGRRREFDDVNIIDVNADDQLTNKNEWLMKTMTEEVTHRPKRKHNMPTQQQKRKHQITYLAFQAKEREMDLKNQWSLNNRTRRETQAKYGF